MNGQAQKYGHNNGVLTTRDEEDRGHNQALQAG
ncbi:hypothetical protein NBRC3299_0603 [Acetobacter pasteurianus NBRC 3299]|nr:hypothetical protein NBRC3299_0603 [Acetobacter pasteurianus NBRC 3299]